MFRFPSNKIIDRPPILSAIYDADDFNKSFNDVKAVNDENQAPPQLCINFFTFSFQDCAIESDSEIDGFETDCSNLLKSVPINKNNEKTMASCTPLDFENNSNQLCPLINNLNQRKRKLSNSCDVSDGIKKQKIPLIETFFQMSNWNNNLNQCFKLQKPSSHQLKAICKKLKLKYYYSANKFWGKINYEKIPSVSQNIEVHSLKTTDIFQCFSMIFTGTKKQSNLFKKSINEAFNAELLAEKMPQCVIDKIMKNSTITAHHLEFITRYLSCRIGIYENEKLQKYGKWEDDENDNDEITVIFAKINQYFFIVLNV